MSQLGIAFEYTYRHEDWVTPLKELFDGITLEELLWKPTPNGNSIWRIALHIARWNENIVDRVEWVDRSDPNEDAHWPELPVEPTVAAWTDARLRLENSLASVARMLSTTSLDKVQASRYGLGDLVCRFTHVGYHLGQIEKIREFYASRNE